MKADAVFRTLYHGSSYHHFYKDQYGLFLIRRSGLWAHRWKEMVSGQQPVPPPPPVDLARETVVVLSVGTRPVLGFDVTIENVTVRDRILVVTATESRKVNGGFDMLCAPVHVVAAKVAPDAFDKMLLNLLIEPDQR